MITFYDINIIGFCSIPEFKMNLNPNCTILIKAPNGSGKSTLFSALVWCLYGKNLKGISEVNTWKEYQPKNYQGTKVEVYFQKDNILYKVIRCQKYTETLEDGAKGKDRLLFYKDTELVNVKGKNNLQDRICQELGLSYNLFMSSIMFGQGLKRLIQESNSDKKKLFEEIFDLNFLNLAKGIALEDKNHLVSEINQTEREAASLKSELDSLIETYKDLKSREKAFSKTIHQERRELKEDRKRLTSKLLEVNKLFSEEGENMLLVKQRSLKKSIAKLESEYKEAKHISNIPLSEFIEHVYDLLANKKYNKAMKSLKKIKDAFDIIEDRSDQLDIMSDNLDKVNGQLVELQRNKSKADDIVDDINTVEEQLASLKKEKLKVLSPKYKGKIHDVRMKLRKVDEDYHNRLGELENYDWLISDPLGNNGIKAYLFDSSLDLLNHVLEGYSEVLGFRIEFNIDLGSTRKDFVTLIERDNHIIDYDELSGGEKQLCNIAMAFAMNESLTASKGINIAFLDEVFESLSQDNIEVVVSLIKHVFQDKSLFLITHQESLPLSNSKILQVEKSDGLSNYKVL